MWYFSSIVIYILVSAVLAIMGRPLVARISRGRIGRRAEEGEVLVLPIGKRSAEYFVHHEVPLFTQEVLLAADVSVGECFQLSRQITEGYLKGEYDAVKICYTRFDSMMTQTCLLYTSRPDLLRARYSGPQCQHPEHPRSGVHRLCGTCL